MTFSMNDDQNDQNQNGNNQNTPANNDQDLSDPDDIKHQKSKPPSVTGEEDAFSGNMPQESPDIDEELEKIGEDVDPEHPKPLGED